ncbi:MAG: patatin-like phospholipase family protein [Desulfatibacillaceae bacterium]
MTLLAASAENNLSDAAGLLNRALFRKPDARFRGLGRWVRVRRCMEELEKARTYRKWLETAGELDHLTGADQWREKGDSPFINTSLLRRHTEQMREYVDAANVYRLVDLLHESIRRNQVDVANPLLYTRSMCGTLKVVENYLDQVVASIDFLCDNDFALLPHDKKVRLFQQAAKNFGRSALMLSGGATFGLFHLGVVKGLLKRDLLPRVISGSSMGAIIAAGTCCRTEDELWEVMSDLGSLDRYALKVLTPREICSHKALLDQHRLLRHIQRNVPDLTFAEAFERSGRILNISVSPTRVGMKPRVLNYITAPNVLVTHAALASSCIPFVYPPAVLFAKDRGGNQYPYMQGERWVDGSIRDDIPRLRMARHHNVNHTVVSQTNPHILPFIRFTSSQGALPFAVGFVGAVVQTEILQILREAQRRIRKSTWQHLANQMAGIVGQHYAGDINLHPSFSPMLYARVMSNPTQKELGWFVLQGEREVWPKVAMINNQTRISRALEACLEKLSPDLPRPEARPL